MPYTCECDAGYTGEYCTERINSDICATNNEPLCLNGGKCQSTPGAASDYVCHCSSGFEGYNCGEQIVKIVTEPVEESTENQIVLGVVVGVASILIVIAIVISALICCMRSRNRQFKHYNDDETGQLSIAEQEAFVAEPKIVRNSENASIPSRTSKSPRTITKSAHSKANIVKSIAVNIPSAHNDTTSPPSYNEVIDSRHDSALLH